MTMRHLFKQWILSLIFGLGAVSFALAAPQSPVEQLSAQLQNGWQAFEASIAQLQASLAHRQSPVDSIRKQYQQLRRDYKRIEFWLAYFDPQGVHDHINGAPLPKVERKAPELRVLEPGGLQVIDETLYSNDDALEYQKLAHLANELARYTAHLQRFQTGTWLQDRHYFEAARAGVIRLYTLGLTGFDTPGSCLALTDAVCTLQGIEQGWKIYAPHVDPVLAQQLTLQFAAATAYLRHNNDFAAFDRLEFLMRFADPIFAGLGQARQNLHLETTAEVTGQASAVNPTAHSLFAPNLLNPFYYTELRQSPNFPKQAALGKLLFFDPILSHNLKRSCASCHAPELAFTDGQTKSRAFDGIHRVQRNSPTLIQAIYADRYFYDLRASDLGRQVEHVIVNEGEFRTDFQKIGDRLMESATYRQRFAEAFPGFGPQAIVRQTIVSALVAYLQTLTATNSPLDRYIRGEAQQLSPTVKRGYNLFMGKAACGTCHFAPVFNGSVPPQYTESESEVLGVPKLADTLAASLDPDQGRFANRIPKEHADFYRSSFKTPTLRNVALTAPYMHNGVYATLEEVVDFYNRGGGAGLGIDLPHQTLPDTPLELTAQDKADLVAFMEALTDTVGTTSRPAQLPEFERHPTWNTRKVGGEY